MYLILLVSFTVSLHAGADDATKALTTDIPETWKYESEYEMPDPITDKWWKGFGDPTLDTLLNLAVTGNYDVAMALKNMEYAAAAVNMAKSRYYPVIGASAGWEKARTSAYTGSNKALPMTQDFFNLGLQASWEIDVFGKIRESVKAEKKNWHASKAEYAATMLSLCSQVAQTYIRLRAYQKELMVANELSESQKKVMEIASVRHEVTLASGLDVSQAKTVYYSTLSTVPSIRTAIATTIESLEVLMGDSQMPASLRNSLEREREIPQHSMPFGVGVPADLLRRRPDIVAAEYKLAAAAAQTGIAKKDFLPTLSLNASIGTEAHRLGNLFKRDALTYSVAPTLSWTIFSGFSRKYAVEEAKIEMQSQIDNYNKTVKTAFSEVNNAMVTYTNSLERIGLLNEVLAESIRSYDYSLDQYKQGLSPFLNLLNSQIDVLNYNNQLIEERAAAQEAVIQLYVALGGGWENN